MVPRHGMDFFRLISIKVPGIAGGNTQTVFTFPDIGDLRYARTLWLNVYCAEDQAVSWPENVANIPVAQLPLCSIVLNTNDPEKENEGADGRFTSTIDSIRYMPLAAIHNIDSNGGTPWSFQTPMFRNTWVVWQKSSIYIAPGGLGNTTDLAITLGVWYTFFNLQGKPVKRT